MIKLKKKRKVNMSLFIDLSAKNKKLIYALRDVYGLGFHSANIICKSLGYDINTKISNIKSVEFL